MRRALGIAVFPIGLFCLTALARADLKTVIKSTFDGHESISTQYLQGKNVRWETSQDAGTAHHTIATIFNAETKSQYMLDLQAREYVKSPDFDPLLTLAMWIQRPPRVKESGKTVDVYIDTTDTGERREIFGHAARHILTRQRRVAEPGACSGDSERDEDGWYISLRSGLPRYRTSVRGYAGTVGHTRLVYALFQDIPGGPCIDKIVMHGSELNRGFPVLLAVTSRDSAPSGPPRHLWVMTREITALSETALDKNLFAPPKEFKRVESLSANPSMSWTERLDFEWRQVEQAFESWFE